MVHLKISIHINRPQGTNTLLNSKNQYTNPIRINLKNLFL